LHIPKWCFRARPRYLTRITIDGDSSFVPTNSLHER
jgi:hypothetical protein